MNCSNDRRKFDSATVTLWLILMFLMVLVGVMIMVIYQADYHLNPAQEFTNLPFPVEKSEYYPGDSVRAYIETCRYTDLPSISYVEMRNGVVTNLLPYPRRGGSIGCYEIWTEVAVIPENTQPEPVVYFSGKSEIEINEWFSVYKRVASWETESFSVIEKP